MNASVGVLIRKLVKALIYLTYYNICLLVFASGIYLNIITMIAIALDQIVVFADIMIRPATPIEDADITTRLVGLLLLAHPFFLGLLFYENLFLTSTLFTALNAPVISYIGIIVYIAGGILVLRSRIQLGRYGDGTPALKENHQLLTEGIYNHIRHPLYAGGMLGRCGLGLSFRGYLGTILFVLAYFVIFRKRMEIEEQLLITEFGDEYEKYMKRTKRLFPYIY
ncbi:MAG: methyltransferase [Candidatus Thorarchaeota archaeon]|jgi:protein-S-isoprenylcysteine O-methyltransferase Ste14